MAPLREGESMGIALDSGKSCVDWLAGEYPSGPVAKQVAARLVQEAGLAPYNVDVIDPHDPMVGRGTACDNGRLSQRLLGRHVGLMLAGAAAGFLVSLVPLAGGQPVLAYHVVVIIGAMVLGAMVGLVLGGLGVSRPRGDGLMARAQQAQRLQHWMVIARVVDLAQRERVRSVFDEREIKGG
jgi:hypothetical protein